MIAGIYCIEHFWTGKKYVGKSSNIAQRFRAHIFNLINANREKHCNRHLLNAVHKFGIDEFEFYHLQIFEQVDEATLADAEIRWMDELQSCDRRYGYNLRRDSATKTTVSSETRLRLSRSAKDRSRGSEGEKRAAAMRDRVSQMSLEQRASHFGKIGDSLQKYEFEQRDLTGTLICVWRNTRDLVAHYPGFELSNLYRVTQGLHPAYAGYIWVAVPIGSHAEQEKFDRPSAPIDFSERHRHRKDAVEVLRVSTGEIEGVYDSVGDAAISFGVSDSFMWGCVKGRVSFPSKRVPHIQDLVFRLVEKPMYRLQRERRQAWLALRGGVAA